MSIVNRLSSGLAHLPRKTLAIICGLLLLGILLFLLTRRLAAVPLELTNSQPASGATNVPIVLHQVTLAFNRPLESPEEIQINSLPLLSFTSRLETARNLLVLTLNQPLLAEETYALEVISVQTGKSIALVSFTTQALDTEGKGDPNIGQKLLQEEQGDFPLLHWVPYETADFAVDYLEPLKLEVTVKTTREAAEAGVKTWMRFYDVDPASHEIVYTTP